MATLTWEQVAFATGPGDDAEGAVRQAYREACLTEPERVITLGSPLAGAVAAAWLTGDDEIRQGMQAAGVDPGGLRGFDPGVLVRDEIRTTPWQSARAAARAQLGAAGWAAHWAATGGPLWPRVGRLAGDIRRAVAGIGGEVLRHFTLDAVLGQHDAPWLSAFNGLDGLKRVAESAGWWWPFERVAVITERPAELHLDELGRLHRPDGPALAYPDGFALHAWHGMPVPAGFGAAMSDLTAERILREDDAELRRVMLEHFGHDRSLAAGVAEQGHRPERET